MAAARSPPELLPANNQLRLPRAIQRIAFSAMLLSASSRALDFLPAVKDCMAEAATRPGISGRRDGARLNEGGSKHRTAGYVVKTKDGRRNRYEVQRHVPLRDTVTRERTIGEVLSVLQRNGDRRLARRAR